MANIVPSTEIAYVQFTILDDETNLRNSAVQVINDGLFKGNNTVKDGLYDARMGTTDFDYTCDICINEKGKCPGHHGHIVANYPLKDPIYSDYILKWLKVICHNCGNLIHYPNIKNKKAIIGEIIKKIKRLRACETCGFPVIKVEKDKFATYIFNASRSISETKVEVVELDNYKIADILNKISDEVIESVGGVVANHPRKLIRNIIHVPSPITRPDRKQVGGGISSMDSMTVILKQLIKINASIVPSSDINPENMDLHHTLELYYDALIKGTSSGEQQKLVTNTNKPLLSISQRLPGKDGHLRRFLLGKRVEQMVRAVITTDPTININEVGVPMYIASKLQIPETVTVFNFNRVSIYFNNGRGVYPGATHIIIKEHRKKIDIDHVPKDYRLKPGDIVFRNLIEGDPVLMNRQPTLSTSSIGMHKVKIVKNGLTLRLNVSACSAYNADFDGDQMHMIICQDVQTRVEISKMANVGNHMISFQTAAPIFGNYYDSLIGISILTKHDTKLSRRQAMSLFARIEIPNKDFIFDKDTYTGRELYSMILPDINFPEKKPSFYMPQYAQFIEYEPSDIKVRINRGVLVSGVLDRATSGQGEKGSINHVIYNEYGVDEAINVIFHSHQMANQFLYYHGFTSGINDILISEKAKDRISDKISKAIADAVSITEKLNNNQLIVPKGLGIRDFYESEQLTVLDPGDDFIEPIFEDIDFHTNGLAELIFKKSKGKPNNFISINGAIGSQLVGDNRPMSKLAGRTAPYFQRYEDHPIANGYVVDSWNKGIRNQSYLFSCAESKHGIINNAMSTCIAGTQMRILVKCLESNICDNNRKLMKDNNLIQIFYSNCGIDPRRTERVKITTATISNKEMDEYHMKASSFVGFDNPKVQKLLDEEFEQLLHDRNEFRRIFMDVEVHNLGKAIFDNTIEIPVNPFRIIDDVTYRYKKLSKGELDPVKAINNLRDFLDKLGYVHFNEQFRESQYAIPDTIKKSLILVEIAIRCYLNTHNLKKNQINNDMLDIILTKIYTTMKKSLIEPGLGIGIMVAQALSEPLTQYVLDSKNRSGGLNKTAVPVLTRIKEIYSAKATAAMKGPIMYIRVLEEFELDKIRVQQIASQIKMMQFESFTALEQIFEEKFGEPVHPDYKHESQMIKDFLKINEKPPLNLIRWCIRFEISRDKLFVNSIRLENVIHKLGVQFPDMYFVHTSETAPKIVIRVYMKSTLFQKEAPNLRRIRDEELRKLNNCIVHGIDKIINTEVVETVKTFEDTDGSMKTKKIYTIQTLGSNLSKVLENEFIDRYHTQTNSVIEFEEMFGIDAARNKIIAELMGIMDGTLYANCSVVADEMTYSGKVTGIHKTGLQVREEENIPLRMSFASPLDVIKSAGAGNKRAKLNGISGPMIFGQVSKIGTTYNPIISNKEFVKKHKKFREDNIKDLL